MNLSSGVYLYALDVQTGAVLLAKNIAADLTSKGEVKNTVLTDILVGDEERLHMRGYIVDTKTFDRTDEHDWVRIGDMKKDATTVPFLKSYYGFLDSSWYTDSYLVYGERPNAGHLLALDTAQTMLYGHQGYTKYTDQGSNFQVTAKVNQKGYRIFARSADISQMRKNVSLKNIQSKGTKPGAGETWSTNVPLRGLAMVAGKERLYMAGVPDKFGTDEDPWRYLEGRGGGVLAVFEKESGQQLFKLDLAAAPVWDGMAAAYGELFISCNDGTIQCFGKSGLQSE
jgi:hypothetical protein